MVRQDRPDHGEDEPLQVSGADFRKAPLLSMRRLAPSTSPGEESKSSDALDLERISSWTPYHLRKPTLLAFAALFAAAALALTLLLYFSNKNTGLSTTNDGDHYFWTYGPTAVFAVISAFWAQIEYRAKQMQPWRAMAQGPQPASQSVLLDYISPWNLLTLFRAVRHSHVTVALAVLGSLLLKGLIVLSTGLFVLQNVTVQTHDAKLQQTSAFITDGTAFNASDVATRPITILMGLVENNLTLPAGTTDSYAFETFDSKGGTFLYTTIPPRLCCLRFRLTLTFCRRWRNNQHRS